jgi:hypothetical protein
MIELLKTLKTNSGRIGSITTVTTAGAIAVTDETIVCSRATAFTITLPATVVGQVFKIANINTGLVTVAGSGAATINGDSTQDIYQWSCMDIQCIANDIWEII